MTLIVFFGPDGSGKTTLALMLKKYILRKYKSKVILTWMRGTHTISLLIAKFLSRFKNMRGYDNPYFNITIRKGSRIWQLLEFFSAIPIILFKYIIPDSLGFYVIGDRCPVDLAVWITVTTKDLGYLKSIYTTFLINFVLRRAKLILYVTTNPKIILQRRKNEYTNYLFLKKQLVYYELIYKVLKKYHGALKIHKIDTSNNEPIRSFIEILEIMQSK